MIWSLYQCIFSVHFPSSLNLYPTIFCSGLLDQKTEGQSKIFSHGFQTNLRGIFSAELLIFLVKNSPCEKITQEVRAATAGKAGKVWSLPRFWVSIRSYKKQLVKNVWGRILDLAWLKFAVAALIFGTHTVIG